MDVAATSAIQFGSITSKDLGNTGDGLQFAPPVDEETRACTRMRNPGGETAVCTVLGSLVGSQEARDMGTRDLSRGIVRQCENGSWQTVEGQIPRGEEVPPSSSKLTYAEELLVKHGSGGSRKPSVEILEAAQQPDKFSMRDEDFPPLLVSKARPKCGSQT